MSSGYRELHRNSALRQEDGRYFAASHLNDVHSSCEADVLTVSAASLNCHALERIDNAHVATTANLLTQSLHTQITAGRAHVDDP